MNGRDGDRDWGCDADHDCPRGHARSAPADGPLHGAAPARSPSRGLSPVDGPHDVPPGDNLHDPRGHDGDPRGRVGGHPGRADGIHGHVGDPHGHDAGVLPNPSKRLVS